MSLKSQTSGRRARYPETTEAYYMKYWIFIVFFKFPLYHFYFGIRGFVRFHENIGTWTQLEVLPDPWSVEVKGHPPKTTQYKTRTSD